MIQNFRLKSGQQDLLDRKMMEVNRTLIENNKHPWTPQKLLHEFFEFLEHTTLDPETETLKIQRSEAR